MSIDKMKMFDKVADKRCQLCNEIIYRDDEFEYFETKRKSRYVIHTECIIKSLTEDVQWKKEKKIL